jgi:hypothetical protein
MYRKAALVVAMTAMLTLPALAQVSLAAKPKPAPGPKGAPLAIVGAGLPMLVFLLGGGYLLVRRHRRKAD